jgi:glucose-6-phosphate dehydrogenase assembly protein OpcA
VIALWDTTGTEVVKALSAERRSAGGVASGLALTLVVVVDERRVQEAETAGATAAAMHPCRLLIVVRHQPSTGTVGDSRLDAEIVVGGRLGPAEAVLIRMHGRLALHAESVVIPLLAPDVPVVTWWHGRPPDQIATDPIGVVADRRITDVAQAADPIAALRQRAADYAAGDTDLAWTRATQWRAILADALDPVGTRVSAASITAAPSNPTAQLIAGWLDARLGLVTELVPGSAAQQLDSVRLGLADGGAISIDRTDGVALLRRSGVEDRRMPIVARQLGECLAEELRRLDADQPYAAALSAATGVPGLTQRPGSRVHVWYDPATPTPTPTPTATAAPTPTPTAAPEPAAGPAASGGNP